MDISPVSTAAAQAAAWTNTADSRARAARAEGSTAPAAADPWRKAGQTCNVRHMTLQDMDDVTMDLYEAGSITLFDRALLTFDPDRFAAADGGTGWLTPADSAGNRDWVAEWEARLAQDEKLGEAQNAANDRRILDILHRLEAGAAPALDCMA